MKKLGIKGGDAVEIVERTADAVAQIADLIGCAHFAAERHRQMGYCAGDAMQRRTNPLPRECASRKESHWERSG